MITGAAHASTVVGLVYIAAFAPDEGETLSSMWAVTDPAPGLASIGHAFDDDFLWHGQDTFHDSFCQDLDDTESMVMATSQRPTARRASTISPGGQHGEPSQAGTRSRPRTA